MKTILFCAAVLTLLSTTGCLVTEGRSYRGHGHDHGPAVVAPAAVVVVPPPVIIVPVRIR